MAGPNSVPAGDKALHQSLMEKMCIAHVKRAMDGSIIPCMGGKKTPCEHVTRREWLLGRKRLFTGKTRG